jgi:hypothetical protein
VSDFDAELDEAMAQLDGAELLDKLRKAVTRYVVLPSETAADAVVLWIGATHGQPAWAHAPRLVIKAPEKRCGKSRLLDVIEATCHNPLITVNASPAAVYRAIGEGDPPTLLVDEADAIFGSRKAAEAHEDLRAILNAGHQRNRPALRYDAATRKVDRISTFAMAALAGIGDMPETIEDRAVIIRMRRRTPAERVESYRHRRDELPLNALRIQVADWLAPLLSKAEAAVPDLPVEDRAADTWEPLVIVADLAGGDWPERARAAAKTLTADAEDDGAASLSVRLLTDCREVFGAALAMRSTELLEGLKANEEAPWATYGPNGLSLRKLGEMLNAYKIKSGNVRFPNGQAKGYLRADFADSWERYCPPPSHPSHPRSPLSPWDGSNPGTDQSVPEPQSVPGATRDNELGTDGTEPPLIPGTDICADCGEPYDQPGFTSRCRDRHQAEGTPA